MPTGTGKVRRAASKETSRRDDVIGLLQTLLNRLGRPTSQVHGVNDVGMEAQVLLDVVVDEFRYTLKQAAAPAENRELHLSPREQEIVRLVAKGLPNKTIAAVLDISVWTVSTHLRRIFGKLRVHSRAEMVAAIVAHRDA